MSGPLLALQGVAKSFGTVAALRGVDFSLASGEIHALLGENGAGKSTLLHLAFGLIQPDHGEIRVHGEPTVLRSPRAARAAGIGMVHQHFASIGALSVSENLALAAGRLTRGVDSSLPAGLRKGLAPGALVESLSIGLRQRLEILMALSGGARILLLDEPTAVLAPPEVEGLLAELREFARHGGAIALVTHKLPEVVAAANRVTVLRSGTVTLSGPLSAQTPERLAHAMIGDSLSVAARPASPARALPGPAGQPAERIRIGDLVIRAGELVGIAAVEGNGQRELLRAMAGVGKPGASRTPVSVSGPVGFIPEDRSTEGLIGSMSLTENLVLGRPDDPRWSHGARLDWKAARRHTARLIDSFEIRAAGPDAPAASLSGGNQQKLLLARALDGLPQVLVAENPTRGLDIRATAALQGRLREAADQGVAVVFYSSDLDEVLSLGRRVLVMHRGLVREAPAPPDRRRIGAMMLGLGDR